MKYPKRFRSCSNADLPVGVVVVEFRNLEFAAAAMADNTLAATVDMLGGSAESRSWQEPKDSISIHASKESKNLTASPSQICRTKM